MVTVVGSLTETERRSRNAGTGRHKPRWPQETFLRVALGSPSRQPSAPAPNPRHTLLTSPYPWGGTNAKAMCYALSQQLMAAHAHTSTPTVTRPRDRQGGVEHTCHRYVPVTSDGVSYCTHHPERVTRRVVTLTKQRTQLDSRPCHGRGTTQKTSAHAVVSEHSGTHGRTTPWQLE